ncbi:MAG: AMP-binding protein, partial [Pseudobdellovibrio sp.]
SLSPPVIRLLLRDKRAPEPAPHLRYVISASSPLYREEFLAFHEKYGIYIHQAYGLSETVNFTLFTPASVSESDLIEAMTSEPAPSAGQATWGNDLYLIDENGNEILNENSRGELVVRGWSLLQNYYQNREATDRAFSQGWFHTGDMAYYRIIGGKKFYYLCGRIKEVIKRNGKLIYLSEVDQAVKTLGIENSCAVGFKNRYTEEEVGLYVSGPTASGLTEKLRELENALHPDKIPKVLLIGSKIPKTSVGKIKRKELERCFHQFFEMRLDSPFWERAQLQENDYAVLFNKCRHLAQSIAAFKFTNKPSDKIKFIYEEATKLSVCQPMKQNTLHQENLTVFKILNLFEKNLEPILSESVNLVDLIERQENWWQQFMCEYPLGDYGTMAADFLKSENLLGGDILEIGAGVGNTSRKIEKHIVDISRYTRTDLNIKLLEKTDIQSKNSYYNFDKPGRFKNQDVIFGTNALHCAADKDLSLQYLKDMLKPGGCLLLAEGSPETFAGTPWALNFLCGIYDGWWNRGGFLTREEWIQLLQKNGFIHIGWQMMSAGRNDLGGIIWAQKA